MEELACVDVLETGKNLEEDALYAGRIQWLVIPRLHQLVQVAVHVLHGDVQSPAVGIQEDVKCGYQVRMRWQRPEENDFSQFQTARERVESLLHCLDRDLERVSWLPM